MINIIFGATLSSFIFGIFGVNWESVDKKIEREYPDVAFITTDELFELKKSSADSDLAIFDVREAEEYAVSHLTQARNFSDSQNISQLVPDKAAPIVVYCSVGYRSAGVASELQKMGYSNVLNLRHSIFEWAEKSYPMIDHIGDVDEVHPFNKAWGSLIDPSLHKFPQ